MRLNHANSGTTLVLGLAVLLPLGCSGDDGARGPAGPAGPVAFDASNTPFETLARLDLVSEVVAISINSPPVLTFSLKTTGGAAITGLVPYWESNSRFIRFTMTKLVPGTNGDPDSWVSYTRDGNSNDPDYDTGSSLVDHGDGTYTFTFNTDVTNVAGVAYEPSLTHRVAGQIGQLSLVPLEEQNLFHDFVPNGAAVTNTRNIAVMQSCNECHSDLRFHGRRFKVEYCVQCHNPDLAEGEGNFAFMIHRIHNAGTFHVLDGGVDFSDVTYPQEVINCRKCHNGDDAATAEGDNWRTRPNMAACDGCHDIFNANAANVHSGPLQSNNQHCAQCHHPYAITVHHMTDNATENNPEVAAGQTIVEYELIDAVVAGSNDVTIRFKLLGNGAPMDVTNLPPSFRNLSGNVFRFPGFLLAYAQAQGTIATPADFNNAGRDSGQPLSLGLDDFGPYETGSPIGTLSYDASTGICTAIVTDTASQFPIGSTMRTVGLQGYFREDLDGDGSYDKSLHAVSDMVAVTGDDERRSIIDTTKCSSCHEYFEGHGGNRVFTSGSKLICVMCHVPNLSSSGRELDLSHPEDAQGIKDLIHGIHSAGFRTRAFEHVRNFNNNGRVYDWSEVTFPRGAETSNCTLCHDGDTYALPLDADALWSTVRTTSVGNGADPNVAAVGTARGTLPNATDWVNSPTASACFYCHTSGTAWAHMVQNGALLSVPDGSGISNRSAIGSNYETCEICHSPGRMADLEVVHNR